MPLRIRVDGTHKPQEFAFDRCNVSIGRGPLNDICISHEALAKRTGVFETRDSGTHFVYLGCEGFLAAHVRETQRTPAPENGRAEWPLQAGDRLVFGPDKAELVVTVFDTATSGPAEPIDTLELSTRKDASIPADLAAFVSRDPTPASILRAIATHIFRAQETHGYSAPVSDVCITLAPRPHSFFDETFILENPRFEDGMAVGEVEPGSDVLKRLGDGSVVFEAIKQPGRAVIRADKSATILGLAIHAKQEIAGVITTRIEDLPSGQAHVVTRSLHEFGGLVRLVLQLHEARKSAEDLVEENRYFRERDRRHYLFKELIVESRSMKDTYDKLNDLVDSSDPVLIHGEAGTGKELLSRALHHLGDRKESMLISLNCARLEKADADVELFGSVESNFRGAKVARKGIFELAAGGTVYLAEIDNLSPLLQGKLVRMIHEGEVRRAGDPESREVSSRLVVSVHRDLQHLVREGAVRRDLYLALRDNVLHVPALRDRHEDIMPLARVFLRQFSKRYKKSVTRFSSEVEEAFLNYPWPGNARELQTRVESATLATVTEQIESEDLDLTSTQ